MSHINRSQKKGLMIQFRVGVYPIERERGKVLAPASFAIMASKKSKEECSQEQNERMHALVAYREEDWIGSDWVHGAEGSRIVGPKSLEEKTCRGDCHDGG